MLKGEWWLNVDMSMDDIAIIPLSTPGFSTVVDRKNVERISQFAPWYAYSQAGKTDYVRSPMYCIFLHRLILPNADVIDHRNHIGLDNRESNLRSATVSQSMANRIFRAGKSGYRGVHPTPNGKWSVRIQTDGKKINIGTFLTVEEAALAYNKAATDLFGDFAVLNIITGDDRW